MLKYYFYKGLPGCGKSTEAKLLISVTTDIVRINKDDIRTMLAYPVWNKHREQHVYTIFRASIISCLKNGFSIVDDNTNMNPKNESEAREIAKRHNAEFVMLDHLLEIPINVCIERDSKRIGKAKVGEDVIRRMHNQYLSNKSTVTQ